MSVRAWQNISNVLGLAVREPQFWWRNTKSLNLAQYASEPLALFYQLMTTLRRAITTPRHAPIPIICIGNLTLGGGGKTPTADYLATALESAGLKPAILSRGYGGSVKAAMKVDTSQHIAQLIGDEPAMLAQRHAVYVGADRHASAILAANDGFEIGIKDDGLQNPSLFHDINILVIDGPRGLGNGSVFPAGPLRERWKVALQRVHIVIMIGDAAPDLEALLASCDAASIPVIQASLKPVRVNPKSVHGFCGIANPEKFYTSLRAAGYTLLSETNFPDHYFLTESDAANLLLKAQGAALMTTEKDAARLKGQSGARGRLSEVAEVLEVRLAPQTDFIPRIIERLKPSA